MLRQDSITTVSHPTTGTPASECDLLPGTRRLIQEIQDRLIAGEPINNPALTEMADKAYGGSRARGTYTARDAYDAMETAVNMLLDAEAPDLMAMDPTDALAGTLMPLTSRVPRQSDRTHEQVELQQFSTPPALAFLAARLLNPFPADTILEPSAGTGSLAIWPRAIRARVVCNEINPRRRAMLQEVMGFETHDVDAEILHDVLADEIQPTGILMNPPFSATGGRVARHSASYGARHIESALRRLHSGGRLVAIAGETMGFTHSAFSEWWKQIASTYTVRANLTIDGKEYGKYGTTFDIQIIVIDKTGPTPGDDWFHQLGTVLWGGVPSVAEAWDRLKGIADKDGADVAENSEADNNTVFVPYAPAKVTGGKQHPAPIVESASMAAVLPPDITYKPHLAREIVTEGRLSTIQLERVIYAGQRHEQRLPDGARAGFYVGDGTGVGKGRILAGIIADNWTQDRQRALWLSVNNDLLESTRRDLADLGMEIPLAPINDYQAAADITLPRGVIFSSYASLISAAKNGARRLDQIQRWLGPDGVVILDEAHKAKNALAGGRGEPTLTGQAVIDLQDADLNPNYRVVYSSATGATDVRNMAYMTRLGLWGIGTAFPGGFQEFMTEIDAGGVGAMEMVSRDMKALGMYASGSISFGVCPESGKAVEYRERIHRLTPEQRDMYNRAAEAWQVVLRNIDGALQITKGGRRARATALNKFWGDHQRFFRQVICAFKVPAVIAEAEKALDDGKSVVISLIGTGETRTREQVAKVTATGGMLEDLDFSPREIIAAMIERGFPTTLCRDETEPATGKTIQVPVTDKDGNTVQSKDALKMKQALIDGLSALDLPENPLDQLVNHFGEKNVAELTGRTRRLIRDQRTGRIEYRKRAPEGVAMDKTNVHEMEQFQQAKKRIAIISDAASTGISLHASNRAANRQRRVHITLELGWSADRQMQTFGRTHRSDQAVPPEYVLLCTELGGEKRFSSTIARRLGSLGALTKGDRGAADNGDLAKYNFETEEGKAALSLLFSRIMSGRDVPGLDNPRQTLRDMGLLVRNSDGIEEVRKDDYYNVPRFLNRVLALDVDRQNAIFDYYADLFDQTVRYAKDNGTFDEGVTDIKALALRLAGAPHVVHTDEITGAETTHYTLDVDRPTKKVRFEEADKLRMARGGAFLQHRRKGNFIMAAESGRHTDPATGKSFRTFAILKPDAPRAGYIHEDELAGRYQAVRPEAASEWWKLTHAGIPPIHTTETHIIGGAIIPLWQRLKTAEGARLRVVRVTTDHGQRIVGIQIPKGRVARVLHSLGIARSVREPGEIFTAILDEGEETTLMADLTLKQGRIHGEPAIELCGADPYKFAELRELGLLNEQINWKQRFFIPTDEHKGIAILAELLTRYPVITEEADAEEGQQALTSPDDGATYNNALHTVDIESWIIGAAEIRKATDETVTGESLDQATSEPESETSLDAQAESGAAVVPQEEIAAPPAKESTISREPFELTAPQLPFPRPAQGRTTPRIVEEQLAFNFSAV